MKQTTPAPAGMQYKTIQKYKKAFTLIEVLLAIFVLEIGLLGIAGFYTYSFKITKTARNETVASNLASGLLDDELAISYDNLLPIGEGQKTAYSTENNSPFANFQKRVDIAYIDKSLVASYIENNDNKYMKKITVTIYWQDGTSEKSFQTASIKAKH